MPITLRRMLSRRYANNRPSEHIRTAEPTWLSPEHWDELLVFVHVPKAAGTSLKDVLWHIYGRGFVTYHQRKSKFSADSITAERAKDILGIASHLQFGFHRMFGPQTSDRPKDGLFEGRNIRYITVVRDPAQRLLSYYRFVTSFPAHYLHECTKGLNCPDFLALMEEIDNGECKNLQCGLIGKNGGTADDAISTIEQHYHAAVTIEDTPNLISYLERTLNWPKGRARLKVKNQSPKSHNQRDIELVREFVKKHSKEDQKLYEHVRDHISPRFI